ncbi:MAG: molybdate ABC transporter substrate-binding protein [Chloroflexi bacterium]|nr:molybdate ABC transporter substrate-binding protein [Chloroflexota bacterium]
MIKLLKIAVFLAVAIMVASMIGCGNNGTEDKSITAFVGSASKPPMEEAAATFEKRTGVKVYLTFGGSGTLLSQMKLGKTGDIYIPGSPDYMIKAERDGVVPTANSKRIAYLIPAICVQKGNPKEIKSLTDLMNPNIEFAIGEPSSVCVGLYAIELLDYNGLLDKVKLAGTCKTYASSCDNTAALLGLRSVDAVIGWDVFAAWNPATTAAVMLPAGKLPRIAYIPAAVTYFAVNKENAEKFIDFLVSPDGQEIFRKWGYKTSEIEAKAMAPNASIGGEYKLPPGFITLIK